MGPREYERVDNANDMPPVGSTARTPLSLLFSSCLTATDFSMGLLHAPPRKRCARIHHSDYPIGEFESLCVVWDTYALCLYVATDENRGMAVGSGVDVWLDEPRP